MRSSSCAAVVSLPVTARSLGLGSFVEQPGTLPSRLFHINPKLAPSEVAQLLFEKLCAQNQIDADSVDFVISCTQTPDFNNPGLVSCFLGRTAKCGIPGLELKQFVVAPLYAIDLAQRLIETEQARVVLVLCVDLFRRFYHSQTQAAPNEESAAARAVLCDGAAALLVAKDLRCGIRFERVKLLASAQSVSEFCVPLPSSKQFPVRITAEDVKQGKHWPRLDLPKLRSELQVNLAPAIRSYLCEAGLSNSDLGGIVTTPLYAEMNLELSRELGVEPKLFFDQYEQGGLAGAAALPEALALSPKPAAPLLCVTASSSKDFALGLASFTANE